MSHLSHVHLSLCPIQIQIQTQKEIQILQVWFPRQADRESQLCRWAFQERYFPSRLVFKCNSVVKRTFNLCISRQVQATWERVLAEVKKSWQQKLYGFH